MSAATGDQPKHYDRHREFFLPGGDLYLLVSITFFCTIAAQASEAQFPLSP